MSSTLTHLRSMQASNRALQGLIHRGKAVRKNDILALLMALDEGNLYYNHVLFLLSFKARKRLDELCSVGLLEQVDRWHFKITPDGIDFLRKFDNKIKNVKAELKRKRSGK